MRKLGHNAGGPARCRAKGPPYPLSPSQHTHTIIDLSSSIVISHLHHYYYYFFSFFLRSMEEWNGALYCMRDAIETTLTYLQTCILVSWEGSAAIQKASFT